MLKLGVVMDPIATIKIKKDSTFAMLLAAQARGWPVSYMELNDLWVLDGTAMANVRQLSVKDDPAGWFELGDSIPMPLGDLDVILMRKDPPFNMEYIYATYILELAEREGVLVVNKPQTLRDANEKLSTAWFPQCTAPTLVTRNPQQILEFLQRYKDIILKPLHGMGGASIFRVTEDDVNTNVIIETLTEHQTRFVMAQRFIPEIQYGDKRILLVDGKPVPYALARVPAKGETRGNLAAGGTGIGVALSERDFWICEQVAPTLRAKGLMFVGLDVIGDYLTEINITSPTCIRELDGIYGLDIAGQLMDAIAAKIKAR
ncbi:MAG: glutathione synthase [Gammaproteobacteria bacterium]|nr:glutathione synthase [Gammaproteobacteria bacterium]